MKRVNKNSEKTLKDMIVDEAVKQFKEGKIKNSMDVETYLSSLLQPLMQKLLDTELENHLDYKKYEHVSNKTHNNSRNGYCKSKIVETKYGRIEVKTPRDRLGTFSPSIIEKGQTKLTGFEDKCISLYAKGMSLRDIEKVLLDLYGVEISKDEISRLISAVNEKVIEWQNRPLNPCYVFTYADCLYVNIKEDLVSRKDAVYVVVGVNTEGYKDILGIYIGDAESASFWASVFEDLKKRGVKDIFFTCSDGVAGFKGSLEETFPKTNSQRCVVHLTRNIAKLCSKKKMKAIIAAWKKIYTSASLEEAELNLEQLKKDFSEYSTIINKVEDFMQYLEPLFELPDEIRKAIYTSNAVESVNSALRKVTRGKGSFPSKESAMKVLFLRVQELKEKWNKPIRNWNTIRSQLIELFGERYTKYIEV